MPPEGTDEGKSTTNFNQAHENLENAVKSVTDAFKHLVDRINSTLHSASKFSALAASYLAHKIDGALKKLVSAIKKIQDKARDILNHSTPIVSLIKVGFRWVNEVTPPISRQTGLIMSYGDAGSPNTGFAYWTGKSRDAYNNKLPNQQKANETTAINADRIGTWLVAVAAENTKFLGDIALKVQEVQKKIAEAAVDLAGIVSIPESIDKIAEAITGLYAAMENLIITFANGLVTTLTQVLSAETILNNDNAYPGHSWPQMVVKTA